jgi:hypothetical protein
MVSYLFDISLHDWSEKELLFAKYGGNFNFSEFLKAYDLDMDPVDLRYKSKAANYYRQKVKSWLNHSFEARLMRNH